MVSNQIERLCQVPNLMDQLAQLAPLHLCHFTTPLSVAPQPRRRPYTHGVTGARQRANRSHRTAHLDIGLIDPRWCRPDLGLILDTN